MYVSRDKDADNRGFVELWREKPKQNKYEHGYWYLLKKIIYREFRRRYPAVRLEPGESKEVKLTEA